MNRIPLILLLLLFGIAPLLSQILTSSSDRHLSRGIQYYQNEQFESAIIEFEEAIRLDSLQSRAYVLLASSYMNVNHPTEVERVAYYGLQFSPDLLQLHIFKAKASMMIGDIDTALKEYKNVKQAVAGDPDNLPDGFSKEEISKSIGILYMQRGTIAYESGDLEKAAGYFRHAREYIPDSLGVHNNLTYLYNKTERWDDAVDAARRGLERFPGNRNLLQMKGQALYNIQEYNQLERVYEKLHDIYPDDIDIGITYAQVLLQNQKLEQGLTTFESLLERHPGERRIYKYMKDVYTRSFRHQGAIAVLHRKREAFPGDPSIVNQLAEAYEFIQKWDDAIAMYDTLMVMTGDTVSTKVAMARIYEEKNEYTEALQLYEWLLSHNYGGHEVYLRAGALLEDGERWSDALNVYKKMYKAGEHYYPLMRMGWVYEQMGDTQRAFKKYTRTEQLQTEHPFPYYRLAVLMHNQGDESDALLHAELALQKAIVGERKLQERKYGFVQAVENDIDVHTVRTQEQTQEELDIYREISAECIEFLIDHFAFDRVEPVFLDLLQNSDASGRFYYYIGELYRQNRYTDNAYHHYKEATEVTPRFRDAHIALGKIYEEKQNYREAILSFERVLAIDPECSNAYRALIRLYREREQLDILCDRWLAKYHIEYENDTMQEYLIEALHKAGRYDDAQKIIDDR